MKIAVVDDEAAMREQLVSYISRFGSENGEELTTAVFPSGDAFWEGFQRGWDIILFDIDMPGTNGKTTTAKGESLKLHYAYSMSDQLTGDFTIDPAIFAEKAEK